MQLRRRDLIASGTAAIATGLLTDPVIALAYDRQYPATTALIERYVSDRRYAGVAIAIGSDKSGPAFQNAGALAFGSPTPVTPDSIFRLYSVTKPFTAVLTLMMIEDGALRLDQPVAEILPEFGRMRVAIDPKNSLESAPTTRAITIEQLLTHTSGLSNWQPFLGDNPLSTAYRQRGLTPGAYGMHKLRPGYGPQVQSLDALVTRLAELPLIAEPGTAWNYSIGFDLLGAIIERVTGKSFDTVMHERILAPLNMTSTGFAIPVSQASRLTTLYGRTGDETYVIDAGPMSDFTRPSTLLAGGGGLVSTARDMTHFAEMLLENGQFRGGRIAKADTIDQAIRIYSTRPNAAVVARPILSAVGASSTMLHVDRTQRMYAIFLAQLNLSGPPAVATQYRPELLAAIAADTEPGAS